MSTIARLKELSAEFQDEMSGISMEEFREIMNTLPKLMAYIEKLEAAVTQIEIYGNSPLAAEWQLLKWRYLEARKAKDEL